ncbi:uncharacterized protein BO95DRAFT_442616 [Aspergillus brunneoviolaceus CBS 621.78]|uniref:Uncharacterized protein n=1 Tax=Aspergillus brunneoviolaceus CBS 621.78 TaxID=1450534 RepID=A0ACD1G9J1_9EURO|nr:hypothetical protein BO95DRAFT_442616 [Aspergillus brunneoviolaceus CBS 621.78]RAH45941.1 hypothetical protein BO95DRAFT_442616 [Aspergillus brunneoviolaceus CBS 621.78]
MTVISINCSQLRYHNQGYEIPSIPLASIGLTIGGQEVPPRPEPPMHQDSRGVTEASGLRAVCCGGYSALVVCTVSTVSTVH